LAKGTPEEVIKNSRGDTARYLKKEFKESKKVKKATA
jgi:excinuclease UvrABC ATPase subunit